MRVWRFSSTDYNASYQPTSETAEIFNIAGKCYMCSRHLRIRWLSDGAVEAANTEAQAQFWSPMRYKA